MGSLVVLPGCKLRGFLKRNYEGLATDYPENGTKGWVQPNNDPPDGAAFCDRNNEYGHNCGCGFRSFWCRCEQKMADCVPRDGKKYGLTRRGSKRSEPQRGDRPCIRMVKLSFWHSLYSYIILALIGRLCPANGQTF
jgi:hypothetical protein